MLVAGSAAAQEATSLRALISLRTETRQLLGSLQATETELFVMADGTAIWRQSFNHQLNPQSGWVTQVRTWKGSAAAQRSLRDALNANRVGSQPGGCTVWSGFWWLEGRHVIKWYSPHTFRRHEFTVESRDDEPTCPPEVKGILVALDHYRNQAPPAD